MTAMRLLSTIDSDSVDTIVLDPPDALGVGESEDETPIDETIRELEPVSEEAMRVLRPGGAALMIGGPRTVSAWDLVAAWAGLRLSADMSVMWGSSRRNGGARTDGVASMSSAIRWHVKPGLRFGRVRQVHALSNVIVCSEVPVEERVNAAQRPVELFNYLISLMTERGGIVVDPYCGSGSALVAAEMHGVRWIGGDINPTQCAIAERRVARVELEEADLRPLYLWVRGRLVEIAG